MRGRREQDKEHTVSGPVPFGVLGKDGSREKSDFSR